MQEDPVPFAGGTGNVPDTDVYGIETEFSIVIRRFQDLITRFK